MEETTSEKQIYIEDMRYPLSIKSRMRMIYTCGLYEGFGSKF